MQTSDEEIENCRESVSAVASRLIEQIERQKKREPKFPQLRKWVGAEIMSTFAHLNVNYPPDEWFGNMIVEELRKSGITVHQQVYDCTLPGRDVPDGSKLQLGMFSVPLCDGKKPYFMQGRLRCEPNEKEMKSFSGVLKEKFQEYKRRVMRIVDALNDSPGENARDQVLAFRREVSGWYNVGTREVATSTVLSNTANCLEELATLGHDFLDIVDGIQVNEGAVLKSVSKGNVVPALVERETITYSDENGERKIIRRSAVYDALREGKLLPSVGTYLLALTVGPELPHLGGKFFAGYAPSVVRTLAEKIGVSADDLVLTTGGRIPFGVRRKESLQQGIGVTVPTFGRALLDSSYNTTDHVIRSGDMVP